MIETSHRLDPQLDIPVHSLYSEVRKPTAEMLEGLDALLIDLQDVGTRVYTYIWTMLHCLEACAEHGVRVVVLDRPNPLGGEVVEGPILDPAYRSFVGLEPIPMRHGLTIGELARHFVATKQLDVELDVVPMRGWQRSMLWPDTDRNWVPPSPNLPRFEGVVLYPGMVLFEGTMVSEGRGTTTPFELLGADYMDAYSWLAPAGLGPQAPDSGVAIRPVHFEPTFQKFAGRSCGGAFLHVRDPAAVRSYALAVRLLMHIRSTFGDHFSWRQPPYEYETEKLPIDILAGGPQLREAVDAYAESFDGVAAKAEGDPAACLEEHRPVIEQLTRATAVDASAWWETVRPALLYL